MRPAILKLDTAFDGQPAFRSEAAQRGARVVDARDLGPALRLWARPHALDGLRRRLREALPGDGPEIVFSGSGDFHHVTSLLVERVVEATGEPLTILHLDNHPDWVRFANGLHCGSWVAHAARIDGVKRVLTVGVCSRDIRQPLPAEADASVVEQGLVEIYPYAVPDGAGSLRIGAQEWPSIETVGESAFLPLLLSRIGTRNVYLTIDKDVLDRRDAVTNWDQGRAGLAFVERVIGAVAAEHRFVGADVVGDWSRQRFGSDPLATILKQGEALLDQPWRPDTAGAAEINQRTNLRLMAALTGVA